MTSHFPFATISSILGTIFTTSLTRYLFSYNFFVGPNPLPLIQLHSTTPNYRILRIGLDPLILHLSFNLPFMNLFGKKKAAEPKKQSAADVIAKLRESQETVEKRNAFLAQKRDQARTDGQKAFQKKDKQQATFHLRRMKQYEKEITGNYGKIANLEMQCNALEQATSDKSIFEAMRLGQEKMKETINEGQLDQVQDLMDDMVEQQQLADEVSDALARPMDGVEIDDDELFEAFAAEVEEQELDMSQFEMPDITAKTSTTVKPTTTAAKKQTTVEEDELAALMM